MRIKVILQNYNTTHTKYQELLSAMLKEQRGERMDEEFIRNRITELRLKKGVSEYQMSMELGQNRSCAGFFTSTMVSNMMRAPS